MPGLVNVLLGIAIFAIGLVVITGRFGPMTGTASVIAAVGAVIAGGVLFVIGASRMTGQMMRGPADRVLHVPQIDAQVALQSMMFVAAADDELDPSEIVMIETIADNVYGHRFSHAEIESAFEAVRSGVIDIMAELREVAGHEREDDACKMIRAVTMVALSDGHFDTVEETRVSDVAHALGLSDALVARNVAAGRRQYDELFDEKRRPRQTGSTTAAS